MMQTIHNDLPHSLKRNPLLSCNVFLRHVVEKMQLYKFLLPVAQTINSFMARFRNVLLIKLFFHILIAVIRIGDSVTKRYIIVITGYGAVKAQRAFSQQVLPLLLRAHPASVCKGCFQRHCKHGYKAASCRFKALHSIQKRKISALR